MRVLHFMWEKWSKIIFSYYRFFSQPMQTCFKIRHLPVFVSVCFWSLRSHQRCSVKKGVWVELSECFFFNLYLRWTKYSVYLTNLRFLLARSSHWNFFRKNSYLDLWSYIYLIYYLTRTSSYSEITDWRK